MQATSSPAAAPSDSASASQSGVKIISWNVAGLKSLTQVLKRHQPELNSYSAPASPASPSPPSLCPSSAPPLEKYFTHHTSPSHPTTIIALQEVKIQLPNLKSTVGPAADIAFKFTETWSCFFSPCKKSDQLGFNGVATYVKSTPSLPGSVISADASPLKDPELDSLGRCLLTDHSEFVLFNIYAPCASGASGGIKRRFHDRLRERINDYRKNGRKVVLVGDFNVSHKAVDTHPLYRSVDLKLVLSEKVKEGEDRWVADVKKLWREVVGRVVETGEVVQQTTTNSKTGEKHEKWRLRCRPLGSDISHVMLFTPEKDRDNCENLHNQFSLSPLGPCHVDMMVDLIKNVAGIEWDEAALTELFDWKRNPEFFLSKHMKKFSKWMDALTEDDGMVDTFRAMHPDAEGRFTCFNQYTNRRYENEGARIDYILIDGSLKGNFAGVEEGEGLSCGNEKAIPAVVEDRGAYADTFEAATAAATFSGAFVAAPFNGAGMGSSQPPAKAIVDQFEKSRSGIIYTPPMFSDHLAVVAKLYFQERAEERSLASDKATKACQPHKTQKSLTGFFSSGANKGSAFSSIGEAGGVSKKKRSPIAATVGLGGSSGGKRGLPSSSQSSSNIFKSSTIPQASKKPKKQDFFNAMKAKKSKI
ncbi:hypothetical protein TrST_g4984 [Triparma strigata]|uniref:Endonuclease/exonuclease/phosphatase domain-containing protein n=1 Tax=Triparma strigata TaxID=1606541 RepID=A0A9W7AE56_9STRA|nr:hypothetical protein TrST_g4984 [Triparma strigata]